MKREVLFCSFLLLVIAAADVLLWRNKKISGSVLAGATATWVIFE
jgi:reticulon